MAVFFCMKEKWDAALTSHNVNIYRQPEIPVRLMNELQSVHSGTVGLSSCVPTEMQSSEQKSSVTRLC